MAYDKPGPEKGDPRMVEHGRNGGRTTRDTMLAKDPDYYKKLGRKGGLATLEKHGVKHMKKAGMASVGVPKRKKNG